MYPAGWIRSKSDKLSVEWDLLAGLLSIQEDTKSYFSRVINKNANLSAFGNGFDVGVRYLGSYTLHKTTLGSERAVDWNLAFGLHLALYRLEAVYKAVSLDGLDLNEYKSDEVGLFGRPIVALQPVVGPFWGISLVPYVGAGSMIILAGESFEDTRFVRNGVNGGLEEDSEFAAIPPGLEAVFGFDLGFVSPFSREHRGTLGGAFSKLYGGSKGDFSEIHMLYTIPWK